MNEGFSTPILVVWDSGTPHRFSGYITEILDIEGYNWRVVHDLAIDPLTADVLEGHQIVILTHIDPPGRCPGPAARVRARRRQSHRSASAAGDGREAGAELVVR